MAGFRNVVEGQGLANWWDNGSHQIAFWRGNKGFIAINNEDFAMDVTLQTGLPAGQYCDIISGGKVNNSCTGKTLTVNGDGTMRVQIGYYVEDPVVAIHANSKL